MTKKAPWKAPKMLGGTTGWRGTTLKMSGLSACTIALKGLKWSLHTNIPETSINFSNLLVMQRKMIFLFRAVPDLLFTKTGHDITK